MNTCSDCVHYSALAKQCRAKPPVAVFVPDGSGNARVLGIFPCITADGWCGELRLPHQVPFAVLHSKANS